MERRSAAEQKSGIGGEMVRTIETNAPEADEQGKTQATSGEELSLPGTMAEGGLERNLMGLVSTLLESALLGNVNCSRLWMGRSEQSELAHTSEKEMPDVSLAEGWLAEPEWVGESSEAEAETAIGSREPEE
jgi:hypothetical protein